MAIEPAQDIPELMEKFRGKAIRRTMMREAYAECLDEECPEAWTGRDSIPNSGWHVIHTGHAVRQHYEVVYEMTPNMTKSEPERAKRPPKVSQDLLRAATP